MMKKELLIICVVLVLLLALPAYSAIERAEFDARVTSAIGGLNREAALDNEGVLRLAGLLQKEYATTIEDMKWAVENSMSWGHIAAYAYIGATTGRSFQEIGAAAAHRDLWEYTEKAGMNSEKMAQALGQLLKLAENERNTRIFDRLRASRRITRMPDLGSGFGLVQEAVDFRRIESPHPDKVHTVGPELAKGEK